jgi:hypothetical protein
MASDLTCVARFPKVWPFSRAVKSVETDTFRVLVVQNFDSVAVENGDSGALTPIR